MEKPKAVSARELVDTLPYIGEYFQPDDRVYLKSEMDKYIEFLKGITNGSRNEKQKKKNSKD